MKIICEKILKVIMASVVFATLFAMPFYAAWGKTEKGGIYWNNGDGTYVKDSWKIIDDDNDGIGYYYYFNENGFLQLDDITPDYKIVDKEGRRIDYDGNPVPINIKNESLEEGYSGEYSEDILKEIQEAYTSYQGQVGNVSSGQVIIDIQTGEDEGPRPSDNIVLDANPDGSSKVLLGPGVTLRDKNESKYDATLNKKMVNYVMTSDKFSKRVNGTTFTKNKWKDVMALKGTGASVVFQNPKNNFNKLKGRIATHYFTYSDRETKCTLYIINNDTNEEIYTTSDFNYNSGKKFECTFYQSVNSIRFELDVSGQYTSRVCYLRDCEFGFDREVWEEEQYDKEVEEEYIRRYGTPSEADGDDLNWWEMEDAESDGEKAIEGESPYDRYRRINGLTGLDGLPLDYDEDDDSITDAMRASISELRKKLEADAEKKDRVSGPAFDESLKNVKPKASPTGFVNMYEGHFEGEDSD